MSVVAINYVIYTYFGPFWIINIFYQKTSWLHRASNDVEHFLFTNWHTQRYIVLIILTINYINYINELIIDTENAIRQLDPKVQNQWQQVTRQKNHSKCSQIQDKPRN